MGFLNSKIISGDQVQAGSPAQTPCLLIPAYLAAVGTVIQFNPGQTVYDVLGAGLGADVTLYELRNAAGPVNVACAQATWSAAPSVTHLDKNGGNSPTGPAITLGLGAGIPGCLDDHNLVLAILSNGQFSLAYDGGGAVESGPIPNALPATLIGSSSAPITPTTLASLIGLTLIFDQPASATLTLPTGSLVAAAAGLMAATATIASPHTYHATDLLAAGLAKLLANPRRLRFTTAGTTPAHVPATILVTGTDYTGATQSETVVPDTSAGLVDTVKAYATITSLAYAAAGGTDATIAIGYEDAYATVAELIGELNTLAQAAPVAVSFFDSQNALGDFLGISTTATGTGAVVTVDTTGTSNTLFGFASSGSASTATGGAATYTMPSNGGVWTFPAGPYTVGEKYLATMVGPRCTVSALTTAAQAAVTNFNNAPFGFFVDGVPCDSAANTSTKDAAYEALRLTWLNDPNQPRDLFFIVSSEWHTASSNPTTNQSNITTNDASILASITETALNSVIPDDVYIPGSPTLAVGKFRRAASVGAGAKRASANRIAASISEGNVPEASLIAADGVTLARDENTSTNKLGGMSGPGFFPLQTASDGKSATFALGATRAGKTSRLRSDGDVAIACETARLVQGVVLGWKAQRPETDTTTGMATDAEKSARHDQVDAAITDTLRPSSGLPNVSGYNILINDPPTGKFVDNGIMPVVTTLNELGTIQAVQVTVAVTGTTIALAA
jgi:hypothetical protein